MRAVLFDVFGPPAVVRVGEMAMPAPRENEVMVKVFASTINPTDILMRSGYQAGIMSHLHPPYIAGMEFSGIVHAVGEGVDLAIAQPVIGVVNPRRPQGGAHVQYVVVPAASVAAVSPELPLEDLATIPMNAVTAILALDIVDLRPGQTLLVTGGTGMMGGSVIQLAHRRGTTVVTTGTAEQVAFLQRLGADLVIGRNADLSGDLRKHYPKGVDALIDGALIGQRASAAVKVGGTAVSLRKSHPIVDDRLKTEYVSVLDGMENAEIIGLVAQLVNEGALTPRVAENGRFTFDDAQAAYEAAECADYPGRIILTFPQ